MNFPKFLTFSDFPTFSHISTSSSSHIENRFIWAWSPVSGEYEYEKNFFKIFYHKDFTCSDMYIQTSTCYNFSGQGRKIFCILFLKSAFIQLSEYTSLVFESSTNRHQFSHISILVEKKNFFFSLFRSPFSILWIINSNEDWLWKGTWRAIICDITRN